MSRQVLRMSQQDWKLQQQLLEKLTLQQVEQALLSLYNSKEPDDPQLQSLQLPEWLILVNLLNDLLAEKSVSNLH